jgi:molecular chaperone GrpE
MANLRTIHRRGDMGRKPHPHHVSHQPPVAQPGSPATAGEGDLPPDLRELAEGDEPGPAAEALVEPADEGRVRLEQEAAEWRDRALRAAAELENVKKRAARERVETWSRAQADLITKALDALDDLGRIAALDPAQTDALALHEGAGLVERKLLKALEGVGLERVDPAGQPFDPNLHEAVMTSPAPSAGADHTVGAVFQPGYRLNGMLLRPARVAVLTWTGPDAGAPE